MNQKKLIRFFGLGKMGKALVYNLISSHYRIQAFDKANHKIELQHDNLKILKHVNDMFVTREDRNIFMLCIPEGQDLDDLINLLILKLEKGDIVIDLGNSNFFKTIKRSKRFAKQGVDLIDFGVSGGPIGALSDPSIMIGCSSEHSWPFVKMLASDLSKSSGIQPSSLVVGPAGAGHFVKMIHNSIEYAVMQMLAETVILYEKSIIDCVWSDLVECLRCSKVMSYLLEITISGFDDQKKVRKSFKKYQNSKIKVNHNGTGVWAMIYAYENNIPMPSIARAVEHRLLSGSSFSNQIYGPSDCLEDYKGIQLSKETFVKLLELAILSAFIQGLSAFQRSDHTFNSKIKPKIALNIWKNGSVLRGDMLSLLLSFEQKFLSTGILKGSAKADHFIRERIEEFVPLKSEINILARFSPCLLSGISFFLDNKDNNSISTIINKQRYIFGGHRV